MTKRLLLLPFLLAACSDAAATDTPDAPQPDAPPGGGDKPPSAWHSRSSGTGANLLGVAFGNEFVAVGPGGVVLTSADGTSWQVGSVGSGDDLLGVTFANLNLLKYIAVGPGVVFTSTAGTSWHKETLTGTGPDTFQAVIQTHPSIIGVGTGGALVTSPDGSSWTLRNAGANAVLLGAANGPSADVAFVAVGETAGGVIYSTTDPTTGTAFTPRASSLPFLHAVTAPLSGPKLIAAGAEGSIFTSDDGISWAPHPVGDASITFNAVAQCRKYVAVGQSGSNGVVATSSDGLVWAVEHLDVEGLNAVACGTFATVAVGAGGSIVSTTTF